jgi:hypothetical protein
MTAPMVMLPPACADRISSAGFVLVDRLLLALVTTITDLRDAPGGGDRAASGRLNISGRDLRMPVWRCLLGAVFLVCRGLRQRRCCGLCGCGLGPPY